MHKHEQVKYRLEIELQQLNQCSTYVGIRDLGDAADIEVSYFNNTQTAYLENIVMPKLIGIEFEPLAKKWKTSIDLAVDVFSNNGNNNGELLKSVVGIDKMLEDETVRLGLTEVTLRKIQDRLNKAMGW